MSAQDPAPPPVDEEAPPGAVCAPADWGQPWIRGDVVAQLRARIREDDLVEALRRSWHYQGRGPSEHALRARARRLLRETDAIRRRRGR